MDVLIRKVKVFPVIPDTYTTTDSKNLDMPSAVNQEEKPCIFRCLASLRAEGVNFPYFLPFQASLRGVVVNSLYSRGSQGRKHKHTGAHRQAPPFSLLLLLQTKTFDMRQPTRPVVMGGKETGRPLFPHLTTSKNIVRYAHE